jgi:membrane-associated phospholipid phosphatase
VREMATMGRRLVMVLAVASGAILLAILRRMEGADALDRLLIAAVPVLTVAVVRRSARETALWAAYMAAIVLFADLRAGADDLGLPVRREYVISWERRLFATVLTNWLQSRFYTPGAASQFDWAMVTVHTSYFLLPHAVAFFLWAYRPRLLARYLVAIVATYYFALAIQTVIPTTPPWLAAHEGALPTVYRVVRDVLYGVSPGAYERGLRFVGDNDVAAMPSLHTAVTVVMALCMAQLGRAGAWVGGAYAALMAFALVYLGEHYAVDTIAGALLAVSVWHVTGRLVPSREGARDRQVPERMHHSLVVASRELD